VISPECERGGIAAGCRRRIRALVLVALASGFVACKRSPAPDSGAGLASAELNAPSAVPQRTTRGDLALRNLSDHIDTLGKRAARAPLLLPEREQWVDLLLTRVQFTGSFADFDRAIEVAEGAVRDFGHHPRAFRTRARAASAVHRFDDAEKDLDSAARLGADVDAALASIRIAQGREIEAARAFARARVERAATLEHLGLLAAAEAALGEFDAADEHYGAALATLRDASPFPVAQLCFQRGMMWAEQAGNPERALPYYVEAVRRLPGYVVANVHLAELEVELGRRDAAVERLRGIVDHSADPEPRGLLGELLLAKDASDAAAQGLIQQARAAYQELLARHRGAFLDHAAEFFLGPGADASLASRLAQENLALRQTPRAYALAIEAALAAHDGPLACRLMQSARAAAAHSPSLAQQLDRDSGRCATR
jgi:tetratricopeptide (TPR) repeat protein